MRRLAWTARTICTSAALTFLSAACSTAPHAALARDSEARVTAIVHVSVIPMDTERILSDQTILVRDGRIVTVGPSATVPVPANATRVDGAGLYAIPGMADMHVHPYDTEGFPSYLAYGITTIAVMHGSPPVLQWRAKVAGGMLEGPTIYSASPSVNGFPAGNPLFISVQDTASARVVARQQKAAGYDFIKAYSMLNPDVYAALLDEAHKVGIPVLGHIPWQMDYRGVLRAGQANVAHIEEFFQNGDIPDDSMPVVARNVARAGTTVTANLFAYADYLHTIASIDSVLADPEMRFASPAQYSEKIPTSNRATNRSDLPGFAKFLSARRIRFQKLLRAFNDAGVVVLLGTDTETFGFPGQSAYLETLELSEAGLRPYDVLRIATRNAGDFMARMSHGSIPFGRIANGMRADMALLRGNPLDDVHNLSRVAGTMARRRWYSTERLAHMRDSVAERTTPGRRFVFTFDSLMTKAKDARGALALLEEFEARHPEMPAFAELVWRGYGRMLYQEDKPSSIGIRALAARAYPESHSAHNEVARGLLFAGDTTRAIEEFRRSLVLAPANLSVQDMLDQVIAARTALSFDPAATYTFENVPLKVRGAIRPQRISVTLRRNEGKLGGTVVTADSTWKVDDVVAGANRLWVFATAYGQGLELRFEVQEDRARGTWILGWANNGTLSGSVSHI